MAKANYKRGELRTIKYTTGAEEVVGVDDVVLLIVDGKKSRVGVARQNIAAASTGIVAVSGVFSFEKHTAANTFSAGFAVNVDADGKVKPVGDTEANGVARFGIVMANSANGDTRIDLDISDPGVGDVTP